MVRSAGEDLESHVTVDWTDCIQTPACRHEKSPGLPLRRRCGACSWDCRNTVSALQHDKGSLTFVSGWLMASAPNQSWRSLPRAVRNGIALALGRVSARSRGVRHAGYLS